MISTLHEVLVQLFRNRPSLTADVLSGVLDVAVPTYQLARLEDPDLNDIIPTEYRADAVVVLTDTDNTPLLAVVVEAQLNPEGDKKWVWPAYLATLRKRMRCPALLLVVCATATVAAQCATPIELGHPGWVLVPLVLGPHQIPVVIDPNQASASPEFAVLSAVAHGHDPEIEKILTSLLSALEASEHGIE